mgnify:CR=1 FL=1
MKDSNETINTLNPHLTKQLVNECSYLIDWSKVKTVEDCVLLLKCLAMAVSNIEDHEPHLCITNYSLMYESMKHLTMDEGSKVKER